MKVIPVIDVLNGVAVHGKRGDRKQYQPLKSTLCESNEPLEIASTFGSLGFTDLYLADLDAILGKSMNLKLFKQIIEKTNLHLMIDAGISDMLSVKKLLKVNVPKIVIGSETLDNLDFVCESVSKFGENMIVVSIDQKNGKLLSKSQVISSLDVVLFTKKLVDVGVNQIILLDLDRVGTEYGTNFGLIHRVIEKTELEVLVGGGIRNLSELEKLRSLGVSGGLVATALHNGTLTVDELKSAGFL